ncbi:MAG: DUF4249 domain-containing protein [Bacteroidales bacterium]|nr:DUF4249 domain-containing protein [Bacteroidales bacterium]
MKKLLYAILVTVLAYSCTYPFTPEIPKLEERLVIEGDILIGSETQVCVSYLMALDAPLGSETQPNATAYVEDNTGKVYPGTYIPRGMVHKSVKLTRGIFAIDTENAPRDREYRLVVKNLENGRRYSTDFQPVQKAPVIDSLSYIINEPRTELDVTLSLTSSEDQKYYRWTFKEEWEYHSLISASAYYQPASSLFDTGQIIYFTGKNNNYYCWDSNVSDGILLGTVEGLTTNKLVNHKFAKIRSNETKLNYIYRMTVTLQSISQSGYEYWKNLDVISNNPGQLDAPNPSEMVGNIVCDDDPREYVIGFINVSGTSEIRRYLYAADLKFYDDPEDRAKAELQEVQPSDYESMYRAFYRPVHVTYGMGGPVWMWGYARCVDCIFKGGSKEKRPTDWINDDI